jgi:hypothetical protein
MEAADALVLLVKAAAGYPTMSFDLTGARVKTRPVAARMAATTEQPHKPRDDVQGDWLPTDETLWACRPIQP